MDVNTLNRVRTIGHVCDLVCRSREGAISPEASRLGPDGCHERWRHTVQLESWFFRSSPAPSDPT